MRSETRAYLTYSNPIFIVYSLYIIFWPPMYSHLLFSCTSFLEDLVREDKKLKKKKTAIEAALPDAASKSKKRPIDEEDVGTPVVPAATATKKIKGADGTPKVVASPVVAGAARTAAKKGEDPVNTTPSKTTPAKKEGESAKKDTPAKTAPPQKEKKTQEKKDKPQADKKEVRSLPLTMPWSSSVCTDELRRSHLSLEEA